MTMKGKKHPVQALSAVQVRSLKRHGRYADGGGLFLVVDEHGKRWLLRTQVKAGRRRDIGLGSARTVSLAEAREQAMRYRKIARQGGDPVAVKKAENREIPTFREAAERCHKEISDGWANSKHVAQWLSTLKHYAYPRIGEKNVDSITSDDVSSVLTPIWFSKQGTARKLRQRIERVLDWAHVKNYRASENPAGPKIRHVIEGKHKGNKGPKNHHAALPFNRMPQFMDHLRDADARGVVKLALEFLILTAARAGEVRGARWAEIDLDAGTWTIPAGRMKTREVHRVPLSPRCLAILEWAKKLAGTSVYIFPGRTGEKPFADRALLRLVKSLDEDRVTVHGFRSTFRDWAEERTNFHRTVSEAALAHTVKGTEGAYRRGDLFEKRRALMNAWANYCATSTAKVVEFPTRA